MDFPSPVWQLPPFVGMFADAYVKGTELEGGSVAGTINLLLFLLKRLTEVSESRERLTLFGDDSIQVLRYIQTLLRPCADIAKARVKDLPQFTAFMEKWKNTLEGFAEGDILLIPGGWSGATGTSAVTYILEKPSHSSYTFRVCNAGQGLAYHPASVEYRPKVKYQTTLSVKHIPASKMLDLSFWSTLFSMWMKEPPSEYNRMEVLYDVLLPWLAGDQLSKSFIDATEEEFMEWRSPSRSNTSTYRSVLEAIRFLGRCKGLTSDMLKQLTFALRWEAMSKVSHNLWVLTKPSEALSEETKQAVQVLARTSMIDKSQRSASIDALAGKVVGVYFGASWCKPCHTFAPRLAELYRKVRERGGDFEVVFVSLDKTQQQFEEYVEKMPDWLVVPFSESDSRKALADLFKIRAVPTLILLGGDGQVLTMNGRNIVTVDGNGDKFPWSEKDARHCDTLQPQEVKVINISCERLASAALKEQSAGRLDASRLDMLRLQIDRVLETVSCIQSLQPDSLLSQPLLMSATAATQPFQSFDLFCTEKSDSYAGTPAPARQAAANNFLEVPVSVNSLASAIAALIRCDSLCASILDRARDSSTSSRLVLQYQVIHIITELFTRTLPVPAHQSTSRECMWRHGLSQQSQLRCLQLIHRLCLTYATMWQSIDNPTRSAESERFVTSACMMVLFEHLIHAVATDTPLILSLLLRSDGGYFYPFELCENNRSFNSVSKYAEITHPDLALCLNQISEYIRHTTNQSKNRIFSYRMIEDKIEVRKYSSTMMFVRRVLDDFGYQLIPPNNPNPPTEMEALCNWLFSNATILHQEHSEFTMYRDMAAGFKFLATMETTNSELIRRQIRPRQWQSWQLTFEEDRGLRLGSRMKIDRHLRWEILNVRGTDMDIADVEVYGFANRKLLWGESIVSSSSADVDRMLGIPNTTEDDVMHAEKLPSFHDTLSLEESELLFSFLTVPYARIPLVVGFFASRDRVTYLFHEGLQRLLRSVLFEPGDWVESNNLTFIENVPLRLSQLQTRERILESLMDARVKADSSALGCPNGLLLNELKSSCSSILDPLLKMFLSVRELGESSIYSADANFVLFMLELAVEVEAYVLYAQKHNMGEIPKLLEFQQKAREYLMGFGVTCLRRWQDECEAEEDMSSACVVHAYLVLLHSNLRDEELTCQNVAAIFGSISFVRNWHGFGQDIMPAKDNGLTTEQRLLRWLQAQGIKTDNLASGSLSKYLTGRPLFLQTGLDVVRAPSFAPPLPGKRYPPCNIPEISLLRVLQALRRPIVQWLEKSSDSEREDVFNSVIQVALRIPHFEHHGWSKSGVGQYAASQAELKIDFQSGEVLWRNDGLKPVPDSMTQYSDFEAVFGRSSLHCGLVARQQHRLCVHVVGTNCDLIEWDEPDDEDQGVGAPLIVKEDVLEITAAADYIWQCEACTFLNTNGGQECEVCMTPRERLSPDTSQGTNAAAYTYRGKLYDRPFDPYAEDNWPHQHEDWTVHILRQVILAEYPSQPEEKKLKHLLYFTKEELPADAIEATLIGYEPAEFDVMGNKKHPSTWREYVVSRTFGTLLVFNLLSHGRKMYRSLIYASNAKFSPHSLMPLFLSRSGSVTPDLQNASGDIRKRRTADDSLVIVRKNPDIGGAETYLPPRLLQGLFPSALLEAFDFWQGEDDVLRATPHQVNSQWFNYKLEIRLGHNPSSSDPMMTSAHITRKPINSHFSRVEGPISELAVAPPLNRSSSGRSPISLGDTQPSEADVLELVALGFGPAACTQALKRSNFNVSLAAQWLLDETNQDEILKLELQEGSEVGFSHLQIAQARMARVRELEGAGFHKASANHALELFQDDVHLARSWLSDVANQEEIASIAGKSQRGATFDDTESQRRKSDAMEVCDSDILSKAKVSTGPGELVLLNLLHVAEEDLSLKKLATTLTRLEDLSHILVWSSSTVCVSNPAVQVCQISLIELPKLKLKFQPRRDANGILQLYLPDHAGWYVSSLLDEETTSRNRVSSAGNDYLNELLNIAPHSLILQNGTGEMQLLLANQDVYRPVIKGDAFGGELICNRGSVGWLEAMETRYYLYPVHTSRTFVLTTTLGSTLYLILLHFLNRNYGGAFQLIDSCSVDVSFTDEEEWIFRQFSRTLDDNHPDAYACRLKLSLAVMYSNNKCSWEIHEELNGYLSVLSHVSAECRLSVEEELDALHLCKQFPQICKARLSYLTALQRGDKKVNLIADEPRYGGQPWIKLSLLSKEFLGEHGIPQTRLTYRRPGSHGVLKDEECLDVIWSNKVIGDEESGSNRGLGFVFLYEVLVSQIKVAIFGNTINRSFAEILLRMLQLKLARWGKESINEGEDEVRPVLGMAILAALLRQPQQHWPDVPVDHTSRSLLEKGLNLYSAECRQSTVKPWLDFVTLEFQTSLTSDDNLAYSSNMRSLLIRARERKLSVSCTVEVVLADGDIELARPLSCVDTSCSKRFLRPFEFSIPQLQLTNDDVSHFSLVPLAPLGLEQFVHYAKAASSSPALEALPFDLSFHPAARSSVAKEILSRLDEDIRGYSKSLKAADVAYFNSLSEADIGQYVSNPAHPKLSLILRLLDDLRSKCKLLQKNDRDYVNFGVAHLRDMVRDVQVTQNDHAMIMKTRFLLQRLCRQQIVLSTNQLVSLLLSAKWKEDIEKVCPFMSNQEAVVDLLQAVLLHSNRVSHTSRVLSGVDAVQDLVLQCQADVANPESLAKRLLHASFDLASLLTAARHFVNRNGAAPLEAVYDPRYLVFEYIFDIILRKRQVEMVDSFTDSVKSGQSRVQQMIMGYGKTTVVGPLLTLILADGISLVTQVMPTALLEQTRNILRSRFSSIVTKRVYTFDFDRSCEDSVSVVARLFSKLDRARRHRDVVCASPEAIKSLMLKFVEMLHSIEQFDLAAVAPTQSMRHNKEVMRLREIMISRSGMADALVRIMDLWQNGHLIMDEVDILLHPLRSELNFPIGNKFPIDLAGPRWNLPMFLCDVVLHHSFGSLTGKPMHKISGFQSQMADILKHISAVVKEGFMSHSLQRVPHVVLLDETFYHQKLKPLLSEAAVLWLKQNFIGDCKVPDKSLKEYITSDRVGHWDQVLEGKLVVESMKLLNLARDWLQSFLPHILSKINRVTYGILRPIDLSSVDAKSPLSRRLMAVPFVGKDVPSRSSEFAHPDIVIGLSILAYRYEGLRRSDVKTLIQQLKQDYSRQVGPRDQRPASILFRSWLSEASENSSRQSIPVLPLPLFQPADENQLNQLFELVKMSPVVIYYYLLQHVFPACMNFQKLKISACGHELGSDILFKCRIGFSGTPSNLLPLDLGECQYEPGSDGRIISVLTCGRVTSTSFKSDWTAKTLLYDVASSNPPFHALIDTGALITGMDNEEVARFLLDNLPLSCEGVVYLDRLDRKMILLRSTGKSINLLQCGIDPDKRFTFYDQVHTTGMDIKQGANARAVLTIGKDMTFRDYAQGAYRMRGIGAGQTIHLFVIPEVRNRMRKDLGGQYMGVPELDIPAWLLINSMKTENVQFIQLSIQEMHNLWRKAALSSLINEVHCNGANNQAMEMERLRRFAGNSSDRIKLRQAIAQFREEIGFPVADHVPVGTSFGDRVRQLLKQNEGVELHATLRERVALAASRAEQISESHHADDERLELNAEVVHENETEAEEEAEEEAEHEEQKMAAFSRDDEQPNPWSVKLLSQPLTGQIGGDSPFYSLQAFKATSRSTSIAWPSSLIVSDNFFRPAWIGFGDRRLKNVNIYAEWTPEAAKLTMQDQLSQIFRELTTNGMEANEAAAEALKIVINEASQNRLGGSERAMRYFLVLSLAEAETLRRVIHSNHPILTVSRLALRTIEGFLLDASDSSFMSLQDSSSEQNALQCLRFFNSELYYTDTELNVLLQALEGVSPADRLLFFAETIRLRRRERQLWVDTPLARVLTERGEWHLIHARAKLEQFNNEIRINNIHMRDEFERYDVDSDEKLSFQETLKCLEATNLGFSAGDVIDLVNLADKNGDGLVDWQEFSSTFVILPRKLSTSQDAENTAEALWSCFSCTFINTTRSPVCALCSTPNPQSADTGAIRLEKRTWQCGNCTYMNAIEDRVCAMCDLGWTGRREVPSGKWACASDLGGCTFFNPESQFYCEICSRARPNLSTVRF